MAKSPKKPARPPRWQPEIQGLAYYNGADSRLNRRGFLVRVLAEARGGRHYVEGIGGGGKAVRFVVKTANLFQPEPGLFDEPAAPAP